MSQGAVENLKSRFDALLPRLGATPGSWDFGLLAKHYQEPHRRYHNFDHIARCLAEFDQVAHLAADPDEVEAAIFFHDVIYDARARDNEERSAVLAEETLGVAGVDARRCRRIADLIRATTHRERPADPDAMLLVDIDLAGLADPNDQFLAIGRAIREEFPHVADDDFFRGRREFFRALLDRESVYVTAHFRDRLEQAARANLESTEADTFLPTL
jgi:predicted metal-dependent HD superfamily phosphohydrolase